MCNSGFKTLIICLLITIFRGEIKAAREECENASVVGLENLIIYDQQTFQQQNELINQQQRVHFQLKSEHFVRFKNWKMNAFFNEQPGNSIKVSLNFHVVLDLNSVINSSDRPTTNDCSSLQRVSGELDAQFRHNKRFAVSPEDELLKYKLDFRIINNSLGHVRYNGSCVHEAAMSTGRNVTFFNASHCIHSVRAVRLFPEFIEDIMPINERDLENLIYSEEKKIFFSLVMKFFKFFIDAYLLEFNAISDSFSIRNSSIINFSDLHLPLFVKLNIKSLDLSNNLIEDSSQLKMIPHFPTLTSLNLNGCGLKTLENINFGNISNLTLLNLGGNQLQEVPKEFRWLSRLEFLNLSSNGPRDTYGHRRPFQFYNTYTYIFLENMRYFDLSHMTIATMEKQTPFFVIVVGMKKLQIFNASNVVFHYDVIRTPYGWSNYPHEHLRELYLSNNVQMTAFLFSFSFPRLKVLDISNNRLTQLPSPQNDQYDNNNLTFFQRFPNLAALNLSGNRFNSTFNINLTDDDRTAFFLDFSNNFIADWNESCIILNADRNQSVGLDLSRNKISVVNAVMLRDFSAAQRVDLRDNAFDCNACRVLPFYQFLTRNLTTNYNYTCAFPIDKRGLFITDLNIHPDICVEKFFNYLLNVILPIAIFITIVIVIVVLLIKFKWYVRFFYYRLRYRNFSKRKRDDAHEQRLTFDAFVCYSNADSDWLVDLLIPNLEQVEPKLHLCIHERDFVAGGYIINNIIQCIDISRKTLCLVTKSFSRSHWCQYELFLAHHKLFEEGNDNLILILLEDLEGERVPRTLQRLMRTRTYLEWPDPNNKPACKLFWARLKRSIGLCNCMREEE